MGVCLLATTIACLLSLNLHDHSVLIGGVWLIVYGLCGLYTPIWFLALIVTLASGLALLSGPEFGKDLNWINGLTYLVIGVTMIQAWRTLHRMAQSSRALKARLAEQDAMLSSVSATIPIIALDCHGHVYRSNEAATRLFAMDRSQLLGQPFTALVPAYDPANPSQPAEGYWTGRRADDTTFPLNIQHSPIKGSDGRDYVALHLSDLSRWHAADAQARELHAQLNKVWRLNSLGEMAATLAHELNQPLSAAANYLHSTQVEMDQLGRAGQTAKTSARLAKDQLLRAGQIIRRMRELLSLEVRSLDRDQAASMVEDLRPVLTMIGSARRVTIQLDMDSVDDRVRADRTQFQQAIVNLVRNAVEASCDSPNPRVVVIGRPISDQAYEISVEDNGPGLPPEETERIFQPLTTTKSGGMGLGLSVTRTIVERHGGRLTATRSALGGAAFSFNLMRDQNDGDS